MFVLVIWSVFHGHLTAQKIPYCVWNRKLSCLTDRSCFILNLLNPINSLTLSPKRYSSLIIFCFTCGATTLLGSKPPHCWGFEITHTHTHTHTHTGTPQSVGLLWTRDLLDADRSTWQRTIFTKDRRPWRRRYSNPYSHQANGRDPVATGIGRCLYLSFYVLIGFTSVHVLNYFNTCTVHLLLFCTMNQPTNTQYIPGRHNDSINIQTVYTATIQDFLRTVRTK